MAGRRPGSTGPGRRCVGRRRERVRSTAAGCDGPGGMSHPPGPVRHPRGLWQRNPPTRPPRHAACRGCGPIHGHHASAAAPTGTERTAGRTATYTGSTRQNARVPRPSRRPLAHPGSATPARPPAAPGNPRAPPVHWPVRDCFPAIRHKALNGRDAANYAGCTRFAHVRAARVSGACTAPAGKGRSRWLNRAPGEGDPRTPRHHQAGRPAPSGITR